MTTLPMPRSMVQGAIATAAVLAGLSGEPALAQVTTAATPAIPGMRMKMESFDRDPGWLGVNNRLAQTREPIQIRQDFGFSAKTGYAGGAAPGEMGGFVTPAGVVAYCVSQLLTAISISGGIFCPLSLDSIRKCAA